MYNFGREGWLSKHGLKKTENILKTGTGLVVNPFIELGSGLHTLGSGLGLRKKRKAGFGRRRRSKRKSRRSKRSRRKSRKSRRRRRRSRRFGYTHDNNGELYGVHYDDGMLLANDAFGWEGNPLNRALNAGGG